MKLRVGFVSNSSSSSFVLPIDSPTKTIEVARAMLKKVISNHEEYDHQWILKQNNGREEWNRIKVRDQGALMFTEVNPMFDDNILISWTTNYESWIFRNEEGQICVNTCNNIEWKGLELDDFKYVGQDQYEAFEGVGVRFIPKERYFLDLADFTKKRKTEYDNEQGKRYGWEPDPIGSGWPTYDEFDEVAEEIRANEDT